MAETWFRTRPRPAATKSTSNCLICDTAPVRSTRRPFVIWRRSLLVPSICPLSARSRSAISRRISLRIICKSSLTASFTASTLSRKALVLERRTPPALRPRTTRPWPALAIPELGMLTDEFLFITGDAPPALPAALRADCGRWPGVGLEGGRGGGECEETDELRWLGDRGRSASGVREPARELRVPSLHWSASAGMSPSSSP
mmetsp:Transcript_7803/g.22366  ORF Transcript_7803/g.22366 Transcript_7803/m.22366 type:complete len:202 (-) Transcript_7803:879-1484(-)